MLLKTIVSILFLFLAACAVQPQAETADYSDLVIAEDTFWSGRILINGQVEVLRGATLTIAPGTDISFVYRDADRNGLGDGTIKVKGELIAVGTAEQPIRFRSAKEHPQPGDWLEIAVDFSRKVHLRYCEIRDSAYTLHAHFTKGLVEDCHIHHNIDGCRIGQATLTLQHNLIEQNSGKGINFRNSRVKVLKNLIRDNGAGLFLFENDQPFEIRANNILNNKYQLRLGDFYSGNVQLQGNWWGSAELQEIGARIYDRRMDAEIGEVTLQPLTQPVADAGPR
jgi:hypothetical protein